VGDRRTGLGGARATGAGGVDDALEESEARYRALFEQSPMGVFTFDRDLRVTDCNFAFVRLLRSSYETLIGLDLRTLDDVRIQAAMERVLEGEPLYFEGPYVAKHSNARVEMATWMTPLRNAHGEVTAGLGLVEDVTARHAAQRALAQSEANFRALIENAPDAISVTRKGGEHLYVNPKFAALLGYEREEMIRKNVRDLVDPDDHSLFDDRNARRDRNETLSPAEYRLRHKDGRVLFTEVISMKVQFSGEPAVLSMIRDLSDRRQMQLQLLQSDRLASVGMLAAGIAHEINNPLAYVMANLEVIARHSLPEMTRLASSDAERERLMRMTEMVAQVRDGAERMRRIVRDVKIFARGGDETNEPVDVSAILDAALQLVAHDLRARARLVRDFAPVPKVEANESRLGQVFLNLLVNALQALPAVNDLERGRSGGLEANEVRVRVSAQGEDFVLVEVIDTGEGIPSDVLPRVFDPFFTTKPIGVGTGLGLFICQGIVTSLGGTLDIRSEGGNGSGTTVSVRLPVSAAARAERERARLAQTQEPRRARVLLADDEPSLGRALAAALRGEHDILAVMSGRAALELLAVDQDFDVILCDLMMPGTSGIDVWRRVSVIAPALAARFVFVTGGAFTAEAAAFLADGREHFEKPFDLEALRALLVRRAGSRSLPER
jgi:two-component system cell cycle sensor histidine kinase/response regulator CckA